MNLLLLFENEIAGKHFLILSHLHDQPVQNMRNKYLPDAFFVCSLCIREFKAHAAIEYST